MKGTIKKITVAICFVLLLLQCRDSHNEVLWISDASKETQLRLEHKDESNIYKLNLNLEGQVDGLATVVLSDGHGYSKNIQLVKGNQDTTITIDWYNNFCELTYAPKSVTKGELKVSYEFYEL